MIYHFKFRCIEKAIYKTIPSNIQPLAIYLIFNKIGKLKYIGETQDPVSRLRVHLSDKYKGHKIELYLMQNNGYSNQFKIKKFNWFQRVFLGRKDKRDHPFKKQLVALEEYLIAFLKPTDNKKRREDRYLF